MKATGRKLSKFFDVQNNAFTAVTCTRGTSAAFYKTKTSAFINIVDLFTN